MHIPFVWRDVQPPLLDERQHARQIDFVGLVRAKLHVNLFRFGTARPLLTFPFRASRAMLIVRERKEMVDATPL
jgi:hypothetical protein